MTDFKEKFIIFFLLISSLSMAACGYRLGGWPCQDGRLNEKVDIPLFENISHEARAENLVTQAFRRQLRVRPCLTLVSGKGADLQLKGSITSVEVFSVAGNDAGLNVEDVIRLQLSVSLENSEDGRIIWMVDGFTDEARYYAVSDPLLARENRREALMALSERVAGILMDKLLLEYRQEK